MALTDSIGERSAPSGSAWARGEPSRHARSAAVLWAHSAARHPCEHKCVCSADEQGTAGPAVVQLGGPTVFTEAEGDQGFPAQIFEWSRALGSMDRDRHTVVPIRPAVELRTCIPSAVIHRASSGQPEICLRGGAGRTGIFFGLLPDG
jgi:hypothetical protein